MSFLDSLEKYKSKECIIDDGKTYFYDDVIRDSQKFISSIPNRSLVFLLGANNYETLVSYIGLVRSKSVVTLLDQKIYINDLKNLIKKYSPNYIILPKLNNRIRKYENIKNFKNFSLLKKITNKKILMSSDLAILLTTSGSTGSPKFVRLSYENYSENSKQIIKSLKLKNDSTITTLPFHYSYGLSIINTHIISGGKIILNNHSILEAKFWKSYQKYLPNIFYGVPFMYEILIKLNFKNFFHKNLTIFTNAGGHLKDETLKKILSYSNMHKLKFFSMYGQTEAAPRMSCLNYKRNNKKFNSIGKALLGGKFKIIDKKGNKINLPFTEGELIYYGKNVSPGYAENLNDLKKKDVNNQKLFTGDLAIFDKENYFYITGRKKRIIKIFGIRISLDEVESILLNDFKIITNCEIDDDKLIIKFSDKKINYKKIQKSLSLRINLNQNYIKFKLINFNMIKIKKNKAIS
jgi:long-chain acyl-CoA synthetase